MQVATGAKPQDTAGVWVKYEGDVEFKVARAGNSVFLAVSDRIEKPFRRKAQKGELSTEQTIDNMCQAMAEGLLMDWKGLSTEDGAAFKHSRENAFLLLRHNPEIREFVAEAAANAEAFRQATVEEDAKK